MLQPTQARPYRGGYRGRGRGRGGGDGASAEDGWGSSWLDQQSSPAAVWGQGHQQPNAEEERRVNYSDPVGANMSDVDVANWFRSNNGQNYARLKELSGCLVSGAGGKASVYLRRIQSDPYAPGSQITVRVQYDASQYHHNKDIRRIALEDLLLRHFYRIASLDPMIEMLKPTQHVIDRSTVRCVNGAIEIHVRAKLPGQGRRIDGKACASILQRLIAAGLGLESLRSPDIFRHLDSVEDQEWLRGQLDANGLVAFVPDDSILPRSSGRVDTPLMHNTVPFKSPDAFKVSFHLPCRGKAISGMGIRKGVTVIVGGGFHGKSTLLRALEVGVYNKIPGDGREYVVVDPTAVKIRSEDRRAISEVDITPFINNIPMNRSTSRFTTPDASGSTSQAANIIEALEMGTKTMLIDEDTSATNFMARDAAMRRLVPDKSEPITPLVERIKGLSEDHKVSTILVAGGSSAFLAVADTVIQLQSYTLADLTADAKALSLPIPEPPRDIIPNYVSSRAIDVGTSLRVLGSDRPKCSGTQDTIRVGEEVIDMSKVEQLVEIGQCNGVAMCLAWMHANLKGEGYHRIPESIDKALQAMSSSNLEIPSTAYYAPRGFVTLPRRFEVAAALNRLRTLVVRSSVQ